MPLPSALLLTDFIFGISTARAEVTTIEIEAGDWDRSETLIHFHPPGFKNKTLGLRAKGEPMLPLQVDHAAMDTFILPKLAKGKTTLYTPIPEGPSN